MITFTKTKSFSKIEKIWNELYVQKSNISYYQSTAYMKTLWNNLFLYRVLLRVSTLFFVFYIDDKPTFILPLFKKIGEKRYVLYGLKAGVGYLDAMYEDNISNDTIDECFNIIKRDLKYSLIHFEHVRKDTKLGQWLVSKGGSVSKEGCTEILLPDVYEDYYNSLSKHMKQNIRTSYNRLRTDEKVYEFSCVDYSNISKDTYIKLQNLYIIRQIQRYDKSFFYKLFVKYIDLGTKIHKSSIVNVKACILWIDGTIAAYYDAIMDGTVVIIPRLAIADGFERYSPGVLLINESIKEFIKSDIKIIDLTHGTEQYKLSMGGTCFQCVEFDFLCEDN